MGKNLANCKPSEFLSQTNKIKKSVEKWLTATKIMEIRKRQPELPVIPAGIGEGDRLKLVAKRTELLNAQARENLSAMLDSMLDEHPEETLEVLALCCFVEPENVDDHPISFYIKSIYEMLNDEAVLGFFSLLTQLGQTNTSNAS